MTFDFPLLAAGADTAQGAIPFIKAAGKFIGICLEVLLLFNLLIFVHELGHFLAAKWRGLYVDEFALWFGKPLWRKKIGGVWYAINSIPAGGYVKLPQMAPMEAIEGDVLELPPEARTPVRPVDKIIVAFAGPLFSFLLALTMATMVWTPWVGKPESDFDSQVIGYIKEGGPADKAGLKVGDEIVAVDGKAVSHFVTGTSSIKWAIIRSEGEKIPFVVKRDGKVLEPIYCSWVKPETESWRRPALREVQIGPRLTPGIGFVTRNSPAAAAGLKANDLIVEADGKPVFGLDTLDTLFTDFRGKTLSLVVERPIDDHNIQRVPLSFSIPTAKENEVVDLGIAWGRIILTYPKPWEQVNEAATSIFRMVGALLSTRSDVKAAHFSGPVGILRLYYQVFEAPEGWRRALALSVLININLAMLNMLPFPVLDGGHITLALIEAVRRKPVNVRLLEIVQTACAVLIIGFMLFVTFYDVGDIVGSKKDDSKAAEEAKSAEPAKK